MRFTFSLFVVFIPAISLAQAPDAAGKKRKRSSGLSDWKTRMAGFTWLLKSLVAKPNPAYGQPVPRRERSNTLEEKYRTKTEHAAFVLTCFDPKTGGFAEPGGKPDVPTTSIGVMAAAELGIPKEKYAKSMDYLKENAKTFEEVRIGAAAVEAWA